MKYGINLKWISIDFRKWYQYKITDDSSDFDKKFAIKGWSHIWLSEYEYVVEDECDLKADLRNRLARRVPQYKLIKFHFPRWFKRLCWFSVGFVLGGI